MAESLLDDAVLGFDNVPSGGGSILEPGQYLVKLIRYERMDDGQWGPRRRWVFNVADSKARTPMYNPDGTLHEFTQATSVKTGRKATARMFFEALLGRELEDGEVGPALARAALGKQALAMIGPNENNWVEILRMSPLPASAKPVAAASPGPAADPFAE